MALDFSIKDNHDRIIIRIPVGLDAFYDIVELSKDNREILFISQKLKDYYEDAEFYISELTILKSELEHLLTQFHDNRNTSETLYLLIKLCEIAFTFKQNNRSKRRLIILNLHAVAS